MDRLYNIEFSGETRFKPELRYEELREDRLVEMEFWQEYQSSWISGSVFDQDAEGPFVSVRETLSDGRIAAHARPITHEALDTIMDAAYEDWRRGSALLLPGCIKTVYTPTP